MPDSQFKKLYKKKDLEDKSFYIRIERILHHFSDLELKDPRKRVRAYINSGLLVGRIVNVSVSGNSVNNRYEVFMPDIERFKKSVYK